MLLKICLVFWSALLPGSRKQLACLPKACSRVGCFDLFTLGITEQLQHILNSSCSTNLLPSAGLAVLELDQQSHSVLISPGLYSHIWVTHSVQLKQNRSRMMCCTSRHKAGQLSSLCIELTKYALLALEAFSALVFEEGLACFACFGTGGRLAFTLATLSLSASAIACMHVHRT